MAESSWTCENGHLNPSREITACLDCGVRRGRPSGLRAGPPPSRPAQAARGTITTLWFAGVGALVVSALVVAVAWPRPIEESCLSLDLGPECVLGEQSGSTFLSFVGLLGLVLAQVLLLVAIVAEGVRLGVRSLGLGTDTNP